MEFKEYKIKEICDVTSSKRIFADEYVCDGVPFYRSKEIIEKHNNKTDLSEKLFITNEKYKSIKTKFGVPKYGDILLTSVGTIGIPYFVKNEVFYFKDGNLTWLRNFKSNIISKYLYYYINYKNTKSELVSRAIGSSQAALTIDILKKFKIIIPDMNVQNSIIKILDKYEQLIENNNRRIKLLEAMAEELYKEWITKYSKEIKITSLNDL